MPSANLPLFDSLARLVAELWPKFAWKATTVALAVQGAIKPLQRCYHANRSLVIYGLSGDITRSLPLLSLYSKNSLGILGFKFMGFLVTLPDLCHYFLSIPRIVSAFWDLHFAVTHFLQIPSPWILCKTQLCSLHLRQCLFYDGPTPRIGCPEYSNGHIGSTILNWNVYCIYCK